jgi:ADP-ribose pyrophosphatase
MRGKKMKNAARTATRKKTEGGRAKARPDGKNQDIKQNGPARATAVNETQDRKVRANEDARTYMSTSAKKPHVLSSQVIYTGKVFGIRRDEVVEPSGVRTTREMITHPGSVVVLPVLPDGRILLIQQYRYAARQFLWELVAGRMDDGETPLQAAERELREETGYRAKSFKIFLEFFPTPGFLEEKMYLLLAEGLTPGVAEPEEDEKIIARAYTNKQVDQMIRKGKVRDAKTIAGGLYYLRYLSR